MIATLIIAAAYALPALLARKRKIGTGKAFLMSILLFPLIALPVVLASKKQPSAAGGSGKAREVDDGKKAVQEKPTEEKNDYGYKEGGIIISDSFILSKTNWESTVSHDAHLRVPQERSQTIFPAEKKESSIHM